MATEAPTPARTRLLSRRRLPDLLIGLFVLVLAAAIVVNGIADVHDTRRARLDKKVATRWFASHATLGTFAPPVVKVHQREDIACAPRRSAGGGLPVDGYCLWIEDTSPSTTRVKRSHRCVVHRPHVVAPKGTPYCPAAHGQ